MGTVYIVLRSYRMGIGCKPIRVGQVSNICCGNDEIALIVAGKTCVLRYLAFLQSSGVTGGVRKGDPIMSSGDTFGVRVAGYAGSVGISLSGFTTQHSQ
jgi:hypothetical protein